jgi:hypothetical protein
MVDFIVENHGSIFLVRPQNTAAADWLADNVQADAQYFGTALAVEHRYIQPLVEELLAIGFEVD